MSKKSMTTGGSAPVQTEGPGRPFRHRGNYHHGHAGHPGNNRWAFVDSTVTFVRQNGKPAALQTFNNPAGPYARGNVYIHALDYNGIALALPLQPELIGVDQMKMTDSHGIPYIREMADTAADRSGFVWDQYPDPSLIMR